MSPGGLPLMRIHNRTYLRYPAMFSFRMEVLSSRIPQRMMTLCGQTYDTFQPCFIGGSTLAHAACHNRRLAFGFAVVKGEVLMFCQKHEGRRFVARTRQALRPRMIVTHRNIDWLVQTSRDHTPILDGSHGMPANDQVKSYISGDGTAQLNYGNYMNTSAHGADVRMRACFRQLRSGFPMNLSRFKPDWPFFPDRAVRIPMAKTMTLIGNRSICWLEITFNTDPIAESTVSLEERYPMAIDNAPYPYEDDFTE